MTKWRDFEIIGMNQCQLARLKSRIMVGDIGCIFKSIGTYYQLNSDHFNKNPMCNMFNGNSILRFHKSASIENHGILYMGIDPNPLFSAKCLPPMVTMEARSKLVVNGEFNAGPGTSFWIMPDAILSLGDSSIITGNTRIICSERINIGRGSIISWNVQIMDTDLHPIGADATLSKEPVDIGDDVWIGSGAIVLKGVKVGDGSVIGAGSIVTRSIPPHSMAVGNPAKVVKRDIEWNM